MKVPSKRRNIMGFNIETIFDLKRDKEVIIESEVQEEQNKDSSEK